MVCSWLYRIRPSVGHVPFKKLAHSYVQNNFSDLSFDPNQLRWKPFPLPAEGTSTQLPACQFACRWAASATRGEAQGGERV
jgi:homogentisate 1,2-dioxygenase